LKKYFLLLLIVLNPSLNYSQPEIIIDFTSGFLLPIQELKGDMKDSADRVNTYEMKSGYSIGAEGKYYFGKGRNLGITFSLEYVLFSNSEPYVSVYGFDVKRNLNAVNFGLGAEYDFSPGGKINPFIIAGITSHIFNGNFEFTYGNYIYKAELEAAKRYGAAAGLGINVELNKSFGIIVGGKYHLANLFGKEYDTTEVPASKYRLQDNEYVYISSLTADNIESKHISYLQFYLGVSLYINQPKKK